MKFQDDISNMNTYIHTYVHTYGQAETNMPPNFFKVWGITIAQQWQKYIMKQYHTTLAEVHNKTIAQQWQKYIMKQYLNNGRNA